jgi:hypothetical protein
LTAFDVARRPSDTGAARLCPPVLGLGAALVALAIAIPAVSWIGWFRGAPAPLEPDLLRGAGLFRAALAALGAYLIVGSVAGWWAPGGHGSPEPRRRAARAPFAILLGILAAGTALRMYRLGEGLWLDEVLALEHYFRQPVGAILTTYESQNQHYLYSLLARASLLLLGESAWALRLPAVAFGIASLAALYALGREVSTAREALLATALAAVSYHHVWFSQNARGYTGLLFWTLLSTWVFVRALDGGRPRLWSRYGVLVAAGMFTHLTMVFVTAGHFAVYAGRVVSTRFSGAPGARPLLAGFGLAACLTLALHALTLPQIVGPALADVSNVPVWQSPLWTVRELLHGFRLGLGGGVVVGLAGAVLVAGLIGYLRDRPVVAWLLVLPAALGSIVMIGLGHPTWPRFYFFVMGFGILVVVRGLFVAARSIGRLNRHAEALATAACLGLIGLSAVKVPAAYGPKQDFARSRDFVETVRGVDDAVVTVGLAVFPFTRYYAPQWQAAATAAELDRIRAASRRTWVVYTFPVQMEAEHADILQVLDREFRQVRVFPGTLNGGSIFVYSDDPKASPPRADGPSSLVSGRIAS